MHNARHCVWGSLEEVVGNAVLAGDLAFFRLLEHGHESSLGGDGVRAPVDPWCVAGPGVALDN
eukprot:10531892-Lingulodinium_polyedra.AAC.1